MCTININIFYIKLVKVIYREARTIIILGRREYWLVATVRADRLQQPQMGSCDHHELYNSIYLWESRVGSHSKCVNICSMYGCDLCLSTESRVSSAIYNHTLIQLLLYCIQLSASAKTLTTNQSHKLL